MSIIIDITLSLPPMGKERARKAKNHKKFYTPEKTESWEKIAKSLYHNYKIKNNISIIEYPFKPQIIACFKPPEGWPAWKKTLALQGKLAHVSKPDYDNIEKIVLDAGKGILWIDDALACGSNGCDKIFGTEEYVKLIVYQVDKIPSTIKSKKMLDNYKKLL